MHDIVPTLTCGWSKKDTDTVVETIESQILLVYHTRLAFYDITEKFHSSDREDENDKHK